ncbi:MAG: hypothetical protein LBF41_03560 [Deltaproteobacteria bacterium]|jgi:predicted RNA-binding Zn-ribbon protein involved in translation (DUF1610 family)|nr:hypothetical protein [Deltaproteobacteria bacterium]
MTDTTPKISSIEKVCHDNECGEKIAALSPEQRELFKRFTFCPYCAAELILICENCREQLNGTDFRYCPWCGVKFDSSLDE